MTSKASDGIDANTKAELVHREKSGLPDGAIVEMVIWRLPEPMPGSGHPYTYRLFYGRAGERIVGFDNERGKGDHCHLDGVEFNYAFTTVENLMQDFPTEVRKRRPK